MALTYSQTPALVRSMDSLLTHCPSAEDAATRFVLPLFSLLVTAIPLVPCRELYDVLAQRPNHGQHLRRPNGSPGVDSRV